MSQNDPGFGRLPHVKQLKKTGFCYTIIWLFDRFFYDLPNMRLKVSQYPWLTI